jgi:squalene-associated FAD-dependent desaturase
MTRAPYSHVHVVGAGLAGLSAAIALVQHGCAVTLLEAGPAAGGRCRSYFDRELGLLIDNGNHLLLSGNHAAMDYLDVIGTRGTLGGPSRPLFPFIDVASGRRWTLRPGAGRVPWWLMSPARRVPDTRPWDYLALLRAARIADDTTVTAAFRDAALYRNLVAPLGIAALNTPPDEGLARLLGAVLRETLLRGGAACVPYFPAAGLSETFVTPAVQWLESRGAKATFGCRVTNCLVEGGRVAALESTAGRLDVQAVVLAVPPWVAAGLLPGLVMPDEHQAILNIHFRAEADPGPAGFFGVIGGAAEWVFVKPGHVSVTISAANRMVDQPASAIADAVWPDVCATLGLSGPLPPFRVVKEKRATFAATATQEQRRPEAATRFSNLTLAGDWTRTSLPATIEGAIRSGQRAVDVLLSR